MSDEATLVLDTLINVSNIVNSIEARVQGIEAKSTNLKDWALVIVSALGSIAALLGAALGYVAAKRQQKINVEIATAQISSSKETSQLQIRSNETVSLKSLEENTETARVQIYASTISQARIEWLGELRKSLSTFIGTCEAFSEVIHFGSGEGLISERSKLFAAVWEQKSHIAMLLNPEKPTHQEVIVASSQLVVETFVSPPDPTRRVEHRDNFVKAARKVLRAEWQDTKLEVQRSARAARITDPI
jgi:hypothetical protein